MSEKFSRGGGGRADKNGAQIVKTLLFVAEMPEEPAGKPVVISNGESCVEKRPLADRFGVGKKRVKLAPPGVVLGLLGYPAGGVPPFDHRTRLPVLLDVTITRFGEDGLIYGGGGDDRTMLELTVGELVRITQPKVLALSEATGL
ncbi:MAG: hypothetical protein KJZ86_09170 [Caldilineaceae bacterium]|nr:hypothetical protein [Caldilineaceae bacterium]HRJ43362.1 YbaK/EbsC family protein [Caldilineaceae bacterium]